MLAKWMMAGVVVLGLAGGAWAAEAKPAEEKSSAEKPRVDVVFVLDSTGSMGGLIEGAKQKIWGIANSFVNRKPSPDLRIGLVTYRDKGDEYITRRFDLTEDIDTVYTHLKEFSAAGGGDGPESVNQALDEAVHSMGWSKGNNVLRVIFLVGDFPPHMDYADDVKYPKTCEDAARAGIVINTIQCGGEPTCTPIWQEIARKAEGEYVQLSQTGDMVAVSTPYDEKIAKLSTELSSTVVPWGDAHQQVAATNMASLPGAMPAPVAAERAVYNLSSGGRAIQGAGDLVTDSAAGKVKLESLKDAELPANMQTMTPEQRKTYLSEQQARRTEVNAQLNQLTRDRADYLVKESAKNGPKGDSFDARVSEIVNRQAAKQLK